MHLSRFFSRGVLFVALMALAMPLVALADGGKRATATTARSWRPTPPATCSASAPTTRAD